MSKDEVIGHNIIDKVVGDVNLEINIRTTYGMSKDVTTVILASLNFILVVPKLRVKTVYDQDTGTH